MNSTSRELREKVDHERVMPSEKTGSERIAKDLQF